MKALIFGVGGQDGSYLAEHLVNAGHHVVGILRPAADRDRANLEPLRAFVAEPRFVLRTADITDAASVATALRETAPDQIYNLAAMSFVPSSWAAPSLALEVNTLGLVNILEAVRTLPKPWPSIYQASSSEMFGDVPRGEANEETPMRPTTPYGVSKLAAHRLAHVYRRAYGMFIACGILFNHESPRRPPNFLSRKVAIAFAQIARGGVTTVSLGYLGAVRDWGFAPDYVGAMPKMLSQDEPEDFVIGTGVGTTAEQFVQMMAEAASRLSGRPVEVFTKSVLSEPQPSRPADLRRVVAAPRLARAVLGWTPTTDLRTLASVMVAAEMARQAHD